MNAKAYKQQLLDKLYEPYRKCMACPLGSLGRTHVVFGEGNPDAALMFVGEGPGREEDLQNRPFVGRSGQLLTKILESLGVSRNDVFITNIVKCRPPNNRKPQPLEMMTCKKILLINQIKIIKPRVICTLGSAALEGLLNKPVAITKVRGVPINADSIIILPTFHPAFILRNKNELQTLFSDIKKSIELCNQK